MATLRLRDDNGLRVHYADHTRFGSAVTGLIDRLVTEGLVARQPAAHDRRAQMVQDA